MQVLEYQSFFDKSPYDNQYIAHYGYHFEKDNKNVGRIVWTKNINEFKIVQDGEP